MARTKSSLVLERQNPQQQEVEAGKHNKRKRAQDKQSRNTPVSVEKKAKKTINHYQFRSNLVSTVTLIQSIKPLVTEQHVVELKKTPFWNLIESMLDNKITEQMCRKYDNDIMLILDTYNNKRRQFRLGKSYVPFTANDISLIFGIPNGTRKLDLKYSKRKTTEFISRRFNTGSRVSAPQIKQQLHLALNGQSETDIADVARLLCLYILVVIFFATHGNTIGWAYVGYVENYMDMNHYAWAEEISKFLMESVHSRSRGSDRVIGCLIALPYWLCEHTTIITPNDSVHLPRLLKWNLRAVTMALRKRTLHSLLATEVLSDELDSTLLEMQRFQPLIESGIHDEREIIDIEGKEEVSEKEKDEIAETEEDNNNEDGEGDEEERDGGEMEEGIEGENVDQGEDQGEGNKEKQNELEEGGQEAENKTIKSNQPDTDIMQDTLVISELEEQLQNNNSEETNYTSVATQSVTFGVEMSGYEEMSLQTDLLVANILADIIGSTSNTVNEEQSEAHSQSVPKAGDNIPCHKDRSQSAENSKLKSLTEERDRATSLVIQLTNEKTELQAQIQRMAIELERMSAEKNIMKKQSIENEIRITSLIVERDDALLFVDQLTREKNSLEKQNMESNQAVEESSRMVSSLKEQLKHTMTVSDVQSSRAANAENEVKSLKKKLINVESNNLKLQKLLKEMTIDYTEKRLELAQKSLDDIFEPPRKFNSQQKESIMIEKSVEEDAANQNFEGNIPEIKSSDAQSKTIKEVKQSSMVKRIKKRTATRKMNPTAAPFTLPKNAVTKLMNASDVEKLKQIYEADGNSALVWGGEGRHAVSYEDIIAVLSRAEMSSTVIDCYAEMLYREQEEIHEQLSTVHGEEMVPPEKAYFVTSLCWKFVTSSSSEMREKILHPQISPSRTANHRFVLFPMNSNGKRKDAEPFHWTLLVLDQKEGDWLHYNSLRPRSAKTVDHYFEDARLLKQYVENYNYINVEDTQPYGAPLVSVDDAPQQKMGSVDCGVVVCYLMKQLTHNQIIVSKLPQHVIDGLRAEIAIKFLNDKHRSWTIENFHARKHPYDDDFEQQ